MHALGSLYYNELGEHQQAVEWFRRASERGCARSMCNLGLLYERGEGVPEDTDQAYRLYKESAEKGHLSAMFYLAKLCFKIARESKSVTEFKMSAHWFLELTLKDPERADVWYYLGQLYEQGYGEKDDPICGADSKTAYQYYRRAAKFEHPQALVKAGDFLYSGKGTPFGKKAKSEAF
jgi:uncharacterized protein